MTQAHGKQWHIKQAVIHQTNWVVGEEDGDLSNLAMRHCHFQMHILVTAKTVRHHHIDLLLLESSTSSITLLQ